jgi:hypothetical protein
MANVRLEKRADGGWEARGESATLWATDLDWAALGAIHMAAIDGVDVELGSGVPADALDQGRRLIETLAVLGRPTVPGT